MTLDSPLMKTAWGASGGLKTTPRVISREVSAGGAGWSHPRAVRATACAGMRRRDHDRRHVALPRQLIERDHLSAEHRLGGRAMRGPLRRQVGEPRALAVRRADIRAVDRAAQVDVELVQPHREVDHGLAVNDTLLHERLLERVELLDERLARWS